MPEDKKGLLKLVQQTIASSKQLEPKGITILPSSPFSPLPSAPMTPPGFAAATAPTRFVFPPPVELPEPGVYEYGFQDFPIANGYQQYFSAGPSVLNNGLQEQNPFGFIQEVNCGYQIADNMYQGPIGEGPVVQGNSCDEGIVHGFEGREVSRGEDPMVDYAEASSDFAALATLPDGFEDEQHDDDGDEHVQGMRTNSLSLSSYSNFVTKTLL